MAWRASAANLAAEPTQQPERKRRSGVDSVSAAEGKAEAEPKPAGGGGAKGAGKRGKQGRRGKPAGSLLELSERVETLEKQQETQAKTTLQNSDALREIQGLLSYTWAFAEETNEVLVAIKAEGVEYHKMIAEEKRAAEEEKRQPDYKKSGPASAHLFPAAVDKLLELESAKMEESEVVTKHVTDLKALQEKLGKAPGPQEVSSIAGVFRVENAHSNTKKIVMKTECSAGEEAAIRFCLQRAGFKVHLGKPPRNGLMRAVQGQLDDRKQL